MVMTAVTAQMGTLPLYVTQLGGNAMMSGLVISSLSSTCTSW
ncbi:hypothetical protein [Leuconostoc lactis]|nr:hypothetical protein [Leuconostoc lactis]